MGQSALPKRFVKQRFYFLLNLMRTLGPGDIVITDGGYSDEIISSPNKVTLEGRAFSSDIRARNETINVRLKFLLFCSHFKT